MAASAASVALAGVSDRETAELRKDGKRLAAENAKLTQENESLRGEVTADPTSDCNPEAAEARVRAFRAERKGGRS